MNKMMLLISILLVVSQLKVDAFNTQPSIRSRVVFLQLAREYIVIGGNLSGVNPNNEDDETQNMSKKERRRREREKGEQDFKSGAYKKKKKFTINYDKLEEKVTRERHLLPREQRDLNSKLGVKSNLGVPSKGITKKKMTEKKISVKAARLIKQRTAGGIVNSSGETVLPQSPDQQAVQIRVAKRGSKVVTMVQGEFIQFMFVYFSLTISTNDRVI